MGTKETRRQRIEKLRNMMIRASKQNLEFEKSALIARFALEEAMTERTSKELIDNFIRAGEFKEEWGIVFYNKDMVKEE